MLRLKHILEIAQKQPPWLTSLSHSIGDIRFRNPVTCEVFVHLAQLIDRGIFDSARDLPQDAAQVRDIFGPSLLKYIEAKNRQHQKWRIDAQSAVDELVQDLLFHIQRAIA